MSPCEASFRLFDSNAINLSYRSFILAIVAPQPARDESRLLHFFANHYRHHFVGDVSIKTDFLLVVLFLHSKMRRRMLGDLASTARGVVGSESSATTALEDASGRLIGGDLQYTYDEVTGCSLRAEMLLGA